MFHSNASAQKPATFLKVVSQKEGDVVVNKFFQSSVKNSSGSYDSTDQVTPNGNPIPFYAYLTGIKPKLDDKLANGNPAPKIGFSFKNDRGEVFYLDLPWSTDKGRVNSLTSGAINQLANVEKFGYFKIYVTSYVSKNKDNEDVKRFGVTVRNNVDYIAGSDDFQSFLAPKVVEGADKPLDKTKVMWKFEIDKIPNIEVKKVVDGEELIINNVKKHQQFFLDIIADINTKIEAQKANYVFVENNSPVASTGRPTTTTATVIVEEDGSTSEPEVPTSTKEATVNSKTTQTGKKGAATATKTSSAQDDDDLPF